MVIELLSQDRRKLLKPELALDTVSQQTLPRQRPPTT